MEMFSVHPLIAIVGALLALLAGALIGASVRLGSDSDVWTEGYSAGYQAAREDDLANPRFIGEE